MNGANWIAVVENTFRYAVTFTAIDNCVLILKTDGSMDKRCDGVLFYNSTVTFVELKQRSQKGAKWIVEGESQLRISIHHFQNVEEAQNYKVKKAYIANSERPIFRESQSRRMNQFLNDTGYVLRIENTITLE